MTQTSFSVKYALFINSFYNTLWKSPLTKSTMLKTI